MLNTESRRFRRWLPARIAKSSEFAGRLAGNGERIQKTRLRDVLLLWLGVVLLFAAPFSSWGSSVTQSAYNLVQNNGTPLARLTTLNCTGGLTCSNSGGATVLNVAAGGAQQRSIVFVLDGGGVALTSGALSSFPTAAYGCTINRTDISADQAGSITVEIWKKAGAIPSGADKISASAPVTLSSAQLNQAGSISGWTTAVSSGDVFGGTIVSTSTVQRVTVQIWCQ